MAVPDKMVGFELTRKTRRLKDWSTRAVNSTMESSVAHQMVMYDALYGSKSNVSFSDENYEVKEMLKSDTCSRSIEEE